MAAKTDLPTGQDDPQGANARRGSVKMSNVWKSARGRFDCVQCWYSIGAAEGQRGRQRAGGSGFGGVVSCLSISPERSFSDTGWDRDLPGRRSRKDLIICLS